MQDSGDMAQGIALARQGQREAAYVRLRKAIFSEGDAAELRIWLAEVSPSTAERVQHLERAAALDPDQPQVADALAAARTQWAAEDYAPAPAPSAPPPSAPARPQPGQVAFGSGGPAPPAPSPFGGPSAPLPPASAPDTAFTPTWASPPATPAPTPPAWASPPAPLVSPPAGGAAAPIRLPAPPRLPAPAAPARDLPPAAPAVPDPPPAPADPAADFDWFARAVAEEPTPSPVRPHSVGDALRNRSPGVRRPLRPTEEVPLADNAPSAPIYSGVSAPIYSGTNAPVVHPDPTLYRTIAGSGQPPSPPSNVGGAPGGYRDPAALPSSASGVRALQAAMAPAAPATRRRILLPVVVVVLIGVALLGGAALVLGGILGRGNAGAGDAPATAAAAVEVRASATDAAAAAAAAQATAVAQPTLTAQAAVRAYSDSVTALIGQIRATDREVADTVHQTGQGVLTTVEAATQLQGYTQASGTYTTATARLNAPLGYTAHRSRLLTALEARAHALDTAASYVDKLSQIPDATQASSAAETDFHAAQRAAQRSATDANVGKAIQTKRAFDTAQAALTRLQTYTDQTEQQFETEWSAYNAALPPLPP